MPTEMELTLEQTQQGVSYEVLIDTSAGNPVKEFFLNEINLITSRSIRIRRIFKRWSERSGEEEPEEKEASKSGSNTWPLDYTTHNDETGSDLDSTPRSEAKPKDLEDICESSV
ncbi:hypothetical protein Tco_1110854 [Tanacetum coccineum]|uniref:Uncharacterized protein n=1 Tax=Tanacetum coccineum TaxID=301880 RepID=A0ABQ5IL74_9ASTR